MEFSFSPKLFVVAVAAALPLMASAADTPSTATARKGFAGYDHPNQYHHTERCNLLNLHDHVGRIRRLRRIRQSTAGGHKMAAFLLIHHQQMCLHNVTGRATVRQQISHCFKIWR